MKNNIFKGELVRWNEGKGFGFISSKELNKDIFIHISSLKRMKRRPIVGDIIYFKEHIGSDGKVKAIDASIEGAELMKNTVRKKRNLKKNNNNFSSLIYFSIFIAIGVFAYSKGTETTPQIITKAPSIGSTALVNFTSGSKATERYSCQGKIYCSEMTSCAEATFYQNNCPGTKMDGDRDGIPCESQWCSW